MKRIQEWLNRPITRSHYFFASLALLAWIYNLVRVASFILFGNAWFQSHGNPPLPSEVFACVAILLLFAAPVILWWIGLGIRRIRALGLPSLLEALLFVPLVNCIVAIVLCAIRRIDRGVLDCSETSTGSVLDVIIPRSIPAAAMASILFAVTPGVFLVWFGSASGGYGLVLFFALPMMMGFLSSLFYSWHSTRRLVECLFVSQVAIMFLGVMLLAFAIEGFFCLAMALPLGCAAAAIGGGIGFILQRFLHHQRHRSVECSLLLLLLMPILMGAESRWLSSERRYAVVTRVEIAAPPETVWNQVVSFSELPPPRGMIFRTGVAYPLHAEIRGQGVGAVRHCVFSTGPFVEPITVWDAPRRLAFNVIEQPHALEEWSPWGNITPRHLDGYFLSTRGEFLLTPTHSGTLLQGTTWYTQKLGPARYWRLWSDYLIHRIHGRVLEHVKTLSEQ